MTKLVDCATISRVIQILEKSIPEHTRKNTVALKETRLIIRWKHALWYLSTIVKQKRRPVCKANYELKYIITYQVHKEEVAETKKQERENDRRKRHEDLEKKKEEKKALRNKSLAPKIPKSWELFKKEKGIDQICSGPDLLPQRISQIRQFIDWKSEHHFCCCDEPMLRLTSKTPTNLGRAFLGCPLGMPARGGCGKIIWLDSLSSPPVLDLTQVSLYFIFSIEIFSGFPPDKSQG